MNNEELFPEILDPIHPKIKKKIITTKTKIKRRREKPKLTLISEEEEEEA